MSFSPDGRVYQVEYAEKAVEKGGYVKKTDPELTRRVAASLCAISHRTLRFSSPSTTIGIKCVDGVVIGVEKAIFSRLLKADANSIIYPTDTYSAIAFSGIQPDGRALMTKAREEAREYKSFYGSHIPGRVLAERVAGRVHTATIYWSERPFGVSSVLSTYDDEDGHALYSVAPTGSLLRYHAVAVGRHRQGAKTELDKIKFDQITCAEAVALIAMILHKLHDDIKDKPFEIEMVWQCRDSGFKAVSVPKETVDVAVTVR
jgi:20S proteasome subunit alpha 7